jgi:hypothetical protein
MQAPPPVSTLLIQLATLAANLRSHLSGRAVDWHTRPQPDEWSLGEIICHLRDVEREVHQARFRAMIAQDNAFLTGVSADEWADERGYRRQDGPAALASFLQARTETVALLTPLPAELWQRQGRHAFLGTTSMHELLFLVTRHDDIHWEQIKSHLPAPAGL